MRSIALLLVMSFPALTFAQDRSQARSMVITKRGKPVAKVSAVKPPKSLKGSVRVLGDVISPIDVEWDANE